MLQGRTEQVSEEKSIAYFNSRPDGSRIGAAVSIRQSEVVSGRHVLEDREAQLKEEGAEKIKKPEHWGGYMVIPTSFEFWQGQTTRIHDRIRFRRPEENEKVAASGEDTTSATDGWIIERLSP
jgi:pyridoxamine 5'-phosphate oxidase